MLIISYPEVIILLSHDFIVLQYHTRRNNIIILCITILDTIIIHNNCDPAIGPRVHYGGPIFHALLSTTSSYRRSKREHFDTSNFALFHGRRPLPTIFVVGRLPTRLVATALYATKRSNTLIYSYIITHTHTHACLA